MKLTGCMSRWDENTYGIKVNISGVPGFLIQDVAGLPLLVVEEELSGYKTESIKYNDMPDYSVVMVKGTGLIIPGIPEQVNVLISSTYYWDARTSWERALATAIHPDDVRWYSRVYDVSIEGTNYVLSYKNSRICSVSIDTCIMMFGNARYRSAWNSNAGVELRYNGPSCKDVVPSLMPCDCVHGFICITRDFGMLFCLWEDEDTDVEVFSASEFSSKYPDEFSKMMKNPEWYITRNDDIVNGAWSTYKYKEM